VAGQEAVVAAFLSEHNRRMAASQALLKSYAAEIGNHMRSNASWEDRTSNARDSLEALTEFTDDVLEIIAKGGGPPDYVQYLELSHAGKYAIVRPTMEVYSGRIYQDLVRIWS